MSPGTVFILVIGIVAMVALFGVAAWLWLADPVWPWDETPAPRPRRGRERERASRARARQPATRRPPTRSTPARELVPIRESAPTRESAPARELVAVREPVPVREPLPAVELPVVDEASADADGGATMLFVAKDRPERTQLLPDEPRFEPPGRDRDAPVPHDDLQTKPVARASGRRTPPRSPGD